MTLPNAFDARRRFTSRLVAGLLSGSLSVLFAATFAGLVFSGELAPYVGIGISMAFFGAIMHGAVIALTSSYRGSIGGVSSESAILGVVIAAVASGADLHGQALLATAVAIVVSASLLTGAVCLSLGRARLGNLIRYIPYPVMGGFVAGVGWLLLNGAVELSTAHTLTPLEATRLFDDDIIWRWAPALGAGIVLLVVQKRFVHFLGVPIILSATGFLFFLSASIDGLSVSELREAGWLLGPFAMHDAWSPTLLPSSLALVRWDLVLEALPGVATYVVTIVIGMLLVGATMEIVVNRDVELNRELRAAGWSNLLAAFGGGFPGYHYIGCTSLHHRMGAGHRVTGIVAAGVCVLALIAGSDLLGYIPRPVAATLLFFMGLDLLWTWLVRSLKHLTRTDYLVVLTVFAFVVAVGFMQGVMVGLILGIALFAFNYSRIDVVKKELDASSLHSRAARSDGALDILKRSGAAVPVYRLDGFIFFGTVNRLLARIRERANRDEAPLHSVILDFRNVRGLDSSAAMYFARLPGLARRRGFNLAITAIAPQLWAMLEREGLQQERRSGLLAPHVPKERRERDAVSATERVFVFDTLDHALEWAENSLLERARFDADAQPASVDASPIAALFDAPHISERFASFGQQCTFEQGESLTVQGDTFRKLFFVHRGTVDVNVVTHQGETVRLRSMGAGSCVGEISLYLGGAVTAHVVAQESTDTISFSRDDLNRMRQQAPDVYALLHEAIAHTLAARLADSTRLIDMLMH